MPKIKTNKGAKKRFKITATGKVMHKKSGSNHFGRRKRGSRTRSLRVPNVLQTAEKNKIRKALGKIK